MERQDEEEGCCSSLKVLMLPWLAHGHISPFLELAKKLTKRNLYVYLCSTPINLQSIKKKLDKPSSSSIQLVELHLPSSPDLPAHLHTTNGLPPQLMATLVDAFQRSLPNLSDILKEIKPDIVIHELMHHWVGELASSLNILPIDFQTASATAGCFFMHMIYTPAAEYPFPSIYLHEFEKRKLFSQANNAGKDAKNRHHSIASPKTSCNIRLINSFRELEGEAIDYFSVLSKKTVIPVGSLTEIPNIDENDKSGVIEWLNKKDISSTVYVSFGSEYFLSKEEMEEVAYGLELSNVNFIWVVRFSKTDGVRRIEDELSEGYFERVGERGMVVDGWAPQLEILKHKSVGGFVSHCGWGSIIETVRFGVPIIACPMQLDQPMNARQMVKIGVALEANRDEDGRIQREELARVIRQVVVDKSGANVRSKAKELGEKLRAKGEEDIDGLVKQLFRICKENRGSLEQG